MVLVQLRLRLHCVAVALRRQDMVLVQLRLRLHCVVFTHVGWKPVDKNGSDMVKSKGGIESRVLAV